MNFKENENGENLKVQVQANMEGVMKAHPQSPNNFCSILQRHVLSDIVMMKDNVLRISKCWMFPVDYCV